jgi:iron-sulfur cluster assembly accessory protein
MQYTSQALHQLQTLFTQNPLNKYFRIAILGGGCSGFQYEFSLTECKKDEDLLIGIPEEIACQGLIIDPISREYLEKAILDYKRDLSGARFLIQNPKEQRVCGCGLSVCFN